MRPNNRKIVSPNIYKSNNGDLRFTKLTETRIWMYKNYDIELLNIVTEGFNHLDN